LKPKLFKRIAVAAVIAMGAWLIIRSAKPVVSANHPGPLNSFSIRRAVSHDLSAPLRELISPKEFIAEPQQSPSPVPTPPDMTNPAGATSVEQKSHGTRPSATVVASFDGLGVGFKCPQGTVTLRNPSDNSLAVGPDHIFQIVNVRMAIYTKKGKKFNDMGDYLKKAETNYSSRISGLRMQGAHSNRVGHGVSTIRVQRMDQTSQDE
jgi:hypothetical protein